MTTPRSLVAAVGTLVAAAALMATAYHTQQMTVAPNPEPQHVVWVQYPVNGLVLVNPAVKDSLGRSPYLRIPEGSILEVPRLVGGPPKAAEGGS